ncbi:hypothetical protein [Alteromonas sp. KUL49]|uniref:hypothetical protein n=1 Tax=Alteromonas sp. KUL49 TaxID=2480798 RepID=UPI001F5FC9DB|nr:hypothetical protein [Alteromonas sp. KUL49]
MNIKYPTLCSFTFVVSAQLCAAESDKWQLIDNFESGHLTQWHLVDTQNETDPFVENPQVTEIRMEDNGNHYLLKKPAQDGIVGNRKALSYLELPTSIPVGETYTFYTRINVENFPNNHAFGLSNQTPVNIEELAYNAFEPTLRVTDKFESNGYKNTGVFMVKVDSDDKYRQYQNIINPKTGKDASVMEEGTWYSVWTVINNAPLDDGGQSYDVYMQGGEFDVQTLVYTSADFRMKRELPLRYFLSTTNTGPIKKPYGNGGLAYDDMYMSAGVNLSSPIDSN